MGSFVMIAKCVSPSMNYGIEALLSGQDIILQKRIRTTSSLYQVSQKTFMYVKVGLAFPWPGNGVNCAKSSWSRITWSGKNDCDIL